MKRRSAIKLFFMGMFSPFVMKAFSFERSDLESLIKEACKAQNVGVIQRARKQLRVFTMFEIDAKAKEVLDLSDPWEYRRLLELYKELEQHHSIKPYSYERIKLSNAGLFSKDREIKEAAWDFIPTLQVLLDPPINIW